MKVVYVTNRGGTHPNRIMYMKSINADLQLVDFKLRWHGEKSSPLRIFLSGIICALLFPKRKSYDIIITSDPQLPAILMKKFGLLRKDQKVVSYLGSQTLYFLYSNYYSKKTSWFYKYLLSGYDAHICNGSMQADLLKLVTKVSPKNIKINTNGLSTKKRTELQDVVFKPNAKTVVFIGNLYSDWRMHYKGIDLMIDAVKLVKQKYGHELCFKLVGEYTSSFTDWLNIKYGDHFQNNIKLTGKVENVSEELNNASLYLHCSRGDAYPNAVIEALAAGIPCILSEWTGTKCLIEHISADLITKLDVEDIAAKINSYFLLNENEKYQLSIKSKNSVSLLTQEYAINKFKEVLSDIYHNK